VEELLALLFSYRVSESDGVFISARRAGVCALGGGNASVKFIAYEPCSDNRALTLALSTMPSENRRLRRRAVDLGKIPSERRDWDDRDQEKMDSP
jgi:hypothetical protein